MIPVLPETSISSKASSGDRLPLHTAAELPAAAALAATALAAAAALGAAASPSRGEARRGEECETSERMELRSKCSGTLRGTLHRRGASQRVQRSAETGLSRVQRLREEKESKLLVIRLLC